jgi:hypothetical protein
MGGWLQPRLQEDLLSEYQFGLARDWWALALRGNTLGLSGGVEERRRPRIYEMGPGAVMLCVAGQAS